MHELSSCYWIPKAEFTASLREALTVQVFHLSGETQEVEAFRTDRKGWVGLPRLFGQQAFPGHEYLDLTSSGKRVAFPASPNLRPEQGPLVGRILRLYEKGETDFIVKAATGKGKTVCGLAVAAELAVSTVVLVDQENLMDQWIERATQHLGLSREQIGIVRGDTCEYIGKKLVIAMVQTVIRREFLADFYNHFGLAIFDESHTAGAPTFSQALMLFPAELRIGLSATPDRSDALNKVIAWNLGEIKAKLEDKPEQANVYIMESFGVYSWSVNNSKMTGKFLSEVTQDAERNLRLAHAIHWLHEQDRDILVIGERVEHLTSLMALTRACGVPEGAMGLYAKSQAVYRYEKDPTPRRRPAYWEKGTEYTPVRYVLVQKTVPKKERDRVLASSQIIFATYGIMAKGVDCPRLSAGIDITPRSKAAQVYGRLTRIVPGKLRPIWITVADVNSFRSLFQLDSRLGDYTESNAEVFLWHAEKGRKPLDVRAYRRDLKNRIRDLRESKIGTQLDGNYMLVTPNTQRTRDD